ncbi:MAG: hypothetical protein VYC34_05855 [Planctomycetota bacterium]|nr:hypothetical protein [Planctomycetota bacterium]
MSADLAPAMARRIIDLLRRGPARFEVIARLAHRLGKGEFPLHLVQIFLIRAEARELLHRDAAGAWRIGASVDTTGSTRPLALLPLERIALACLADGRPDDVDAIAVRSLDRLGLIDADSRLTCRGARIGAAHRDLEHLSTRNRSLDFVTAPPLGRPARKA